MEKQYDPNLLESKWYPRWDRAGLFAPREDEGDGEPFVITLPPPNVTGILHIGHCLGAGIMDSLVRYYRMRGRPTLFLPGSDHASIATENKVWAQLAENGIGREDTTREAFLDHAWKWSMDHRGIIGNQLRRYGVSLDWSREAFTMDEERSRAVSEAFVRLWRKGLIYRGDYMTNWSVAQQSAVSDEEVEHREVEGHLWHFRYPLKEGGHLVVATTRPETMLGDTAVAVHPTAEKTAHLVGKTVLLPLVDREIPVVADEHVDPEFGTGCVKVTPAHDPNDYEIGKRHELPLINILNPDGTLNTAVPEDYQGLDRFVARKKIVADFEAAGLLEKVEPHTHSVGYHDRTNTVIEPYISRQWFLKMDDLAKPALAAVEDGTLRIYPDRWVGVYYNWMRNIRDWCISRQLWWGHRIPFYSCVGCAWEDAAVEATTACPECGSAVSQDNDVLDTWFSSWLWTFSPLGWPENTNDLQRFHPTSVLVTGADIIFFWVARMVMASQEFLHELPFREVLFTGIVRDGQGRKLSKSLGNSPDPLGLMDQYGADALRFVLVMLTPTGSDINFDDSSCEVGRNFCTKIWNATRLLFSNLEEAGFEFTPAHVELMEAELGGEVQDVENWFGDFWTRTTGSTLPAGERAPLALEDQWMLHRVAHAAVAVEKAMEARRLNDAAHAAYDCFRHEFCDWYLEAIKARLHDGREPERRTALLVALAVHSMMLRLLHPFLPYITEELWELHPATAGFCMVAPMPRFAAGIPFERAAARFETVKDLVSAARNLRSELGVAPGRRGQGVLVAPAEKAALLGELAAQVAYLAKLEQVELATTKPEQAVVAIVGDVELHLPMAGLVDFEKEKQRLGKECEQLQKRLGAIRGKLGNASFVDRAPAEVVERERANEAKLLETLQKLEAQIAQLG